MKELSKSQLVLALCVIMVAKTLGKGVKNK